MQHTKLRALISRVTSITITLKASCQWNWQACRPKSDRQRKAQLQKLAMTRKVLDVTERTECGLLRPGKTPVKAPVLASPAVKHAHFAERVKHSNKWRHHGREKQYNLRWERARWITWSVRHLDWYGELTQPRMLGIKGSRVHYGKPVLCVALSPLESSRSSASERLCSAEQRQRVEQLKWEFQPRFRAVGALKKRQ